jgi:hypothetical protein
MPLCPPKVAQLIASAPFGRIEVLGLSEATVHLSAHAVRHGPRAAFPAEARIIAKIGARGFEQAGATPRIVLSARLICALRAAV